MTNPIETIREVAKARERAATEFRKCKHPVAELSELADAKTLRDAADALEQREAQAERYMEALLVERDAGEETLTQLIEPMTNPLIEMLRDVARRHQEEYDALVRHCVYYSRQPLLKAQAICLFAAADALEQREARVAEVASELREYIVANEEMEDGPPYFLGGPTYKEAVCWANTLEGRDE
jgi:hypothetical protein